MSNIIKGSLVAVALLGFAGVASAANFTNIEFENGDVEIQGKGGSTVEATFRIVVDDGEVVEMLQTDVMGDDLGPRCMTVGGSRGLEEGTHYVDRDIKLPPNTGTYDVAVQGSGIFGGQRAIDCEDDVVGNNTFSDALRVVGSQVDDNDDDLGGDEDDTPAWVKALIAAILGNKPSKPAYCAQVNAAAFYHGMTGPSVTAYQSLLIANGFAIPAGATGFFGTQSAFAHAQAKAACI